jgi:hypothetical protein
MVRYLTTNGCTCGEPVEASGRTVGIITVRSQLQGNLNRQGIAENALAIFSTAYPSVFHLHPVGKRGTAFGRDVNFPDCRVAGCLGAAVAFF